MSAVDGNDEQFRFISDEKGNEQIDDEKEELERFPHTDRSVTDRTEVAHHEVTTGRFSSSVFATYSDNDWHSTERTAGVSPVISDCFY